MYKPADHDLPNNAHPSHSATTGGAAGLNETPRGERLHIAVFGRRNAGKSSLINAIANQEVSIVSSTPGTTTDPVYKTMEILPIGPVVLVDTAGLDDEGILGGERVRRSLDVLDKTDLALLAVDTPEGWGSPEDKIVSLLQERRLPLVVALNKVDVLSPDTVARIRTAAANRFPPTVPVIPASARTKAGIEALKSAIIEAASPDREEPTLIGDLVQAGDTVILVAPIDRSAPKSRLILPQVQVIRDLLDHHAQALTIQSEELPAALASLRNPPRMVITDSQAFKTVNTLTPAEITLTSFSILFARYKGDLCELAAGAKAIERLRRGDHILIAEACTHHRTDDDIGKVKIPSWLEQKVGGKLSYTWVSGGTLPADLSEFQLVVHCGACMLNRRQMLARLHRITSAGVPVVNYGVGIAYLHGILPRTLSPFPDALRVIRSRQQCGLQPAQPEDTLAPGQF
ncbi:[FeFe] hydrogenase H-cluster maturation GTPase HydF [Acididesulfobacillus acetoxydans]|nr:[FeFe] hydrogenase H-cluster maturation GTPase HydF [Acididesulfobacillus acetoxydans]